MKHLAAWYAEVEKASWKDTAELKMQFRSASILSRERVVFNIKGTHKEYDKIDATMVVYEKERYAGSSNSK